MSSFDVVNVIISKNSYVLTHSYSGLGAVDPWWEKIFTKDDTPAGRIERNALVDISCIYLYC